MTIKIQYVILPDPECVSFVPKTQQDERQQQQRQKRVDNVNPPQKNFPASLHGMAQHKHRDFMCKYVLFLCVASPHPPGTNGNYANKGLSELF